MRGLKGDPLNNVVEQVRNGIIEQCLAAIASLRALANKEQAT